MDTLKVINGRKSIRAFAPSPVSREEIEKVLKAAIKAPSKGNSQIWEFVVVTGKKKKDMDKMLSELLKTDLIPAMKLSDSGREVHNEALERAARRSKQNSQGMSNLLSPLNLSTEKFMLEGTFTFFKAPVAILLFVDDVFAKDLPHILSVGSAVQNILLSAVDTGLGACWIGGVWRYTKDIRMLLEIPENKKLLSAIALGYPDLNSPINKFKATRDNISEFVRWIGFSE